MSDPRSSPTDSPLGLTVHTMPDLGQATVRSAAATRSGRLKMLGVLLACAAPVVASYFTYYVVRPQARTNYGELVQPPVEMPALKAIDKAGQTVSLDTLKQQWLFVSVADSACDAQCERHLYLQRQLREGLGKEKDRIDWVWLRTGDQPLTETLKNATAAATVLQMDESAIASWLQPEAGHRLSEHLYLVDPMGRWMMRFPVQPDPAKMRKDLERLLRASNSWDRAGRP